MEFNSDLFSFITPVVVDNGKFFINDMFQRKYRQNAPDVTNHLIAFYNTNNVFLPVSYLSFLPHDNVLLVGGGMTDGRAIRQMSSDEQETIANNDGILYFMLKYGFEYFGSQCEAFFGYVNDPRAYKIDIKAGFEQTQYPYLVAHYHTPTSRQCKDSLEKKIHDIGPF